MLVNPPRVDGFVVVREERYEHKDVGALYPPLSLLYTAAVLERVDVPVQLLDANGFDLSQEDVQSRIDEFKPDVILARCGFDTQEEDVQCLKYAKEKHGSITLLRNKIIGDVAWLKKDFLERFPFIDFFLDYEPDSILVDIIKALEKSIENGRLNAKGVSFLANDSLKSNPPGNLEGDLDKLPFPAYHLLPSLKPYHTGVLDQPFALVNTSRGCPFPCTFCAYHRSGYRTRSPENVIEELKFLKKTHGLKSFLFFDDVIGLQKGRFEKICELMIQEKLNLKWVACTRANLVNLEQLKLMKKAGCQELAFGIESGDPEVLKRTNKGITLKEIEEATRLCKKAGILFYGMAIIGLPGETRQSIENTVRFIKKINPFYTQFCFSTPFPNTDIYKDYEEKGLLMTKDWKQYSPLAPVPVVRTETLSQDDLVELRNLVYRRIILDFRYLFSKIRLFDWKWNIEGFIKIMGRIKAILLRRFVR